MASFTEFYEREYASVYRAVRFVVGPDEAFDVTQDAFHKAYVRWRRLSKHEWAGGWVMTTALNLAKRNRQRPMVNSDGRAPAPAAGEARLDLVAALRRLPHRQAQALVLTYIGDLPVAAVADLMGTSEGTVKSHLARGRAALRKLMEDHDG